MTLRAEFNPECQFVVSTPRELIVGSSRFKMGEPFDKTLVSTRLLRQLYEARQISVAVTDEFMEAASPVKQKTSRPRRRFNNGGST